jgi:hypothetical protein
MSTFGLTPEGQAFLESGFTPQYNVNTTYPLIPNSQQYVMYNKYISIHSEDRDILKYPNSSEFEIELPEDLLNVASIRLVNWTFPANYNTFSPSNGNVIFAYKITNPYNPAAFGLSDDYNYRIYEALFMTQNEPYILTIEEGFYNPNQMTTELTNKMNFTTSRRISTYFTEKGWTDTLNEFNSKGGYTRFIVVYNNVSFKIWFGNRADGFLIINEIGVFTNTFLDGLCLSDYAHVPDSSNWGLPGYLGLPRCNVESVSTSSSTNISTFQQVNGITVPRFYYGDVTPGDDGFWLLPYLDFSGSEVYWVETFDKINLMGEAYMYMEIEGQNCIDETQPYNISKFTQTTNQTNGIVNSAFAKLGIPTTPLSQWFDRDAVPYKLYMPPAERIRRLKIKIRYHNGRIVNFGVFNYSFMLQFTLMVPQILRSTRTMVYPPPIGL